ncbi:hypothetical protein GCM10022419_024320 [Nonomuraea rosea]|uniref:Recombinase domain-containing protein n=1 Tax=Nonomuraea rosea TaxID=638574 RepID=A0ABP6VYJ2_9ACTN
MVGEPQRAFYGNQFGNTFELFNHYGVPLWVPEVGGAIDPTNEAHELIMLMFGGISKGERNRIKMRVRTTMEAQAKIEGRFLGGRPPYGYRLMDAGPHPNPSKAADGKRLHRLEPDPLTASNVARIFDEFVQGQGLYLIAEGLTREGVPRPYVLRHLLHCGVCERRMEGTWNNGRANYRCKFPTEYALANRIEHPRTVYVREDHILAELDPWIGQVFDPAALEQTVQALMDAQSNEMDLIAIEAATKTIDDCDQRMTRYRATLDAGGDPQEVGKWMAETRAERMQAEGRLRAINRKREITEKEIQEMIPTMAELPKILRKADPTDRNDLYMQMGLHLVYDPSMRVVTVEARPRMYQSACPRGDLNPHAHHWALAPQASASAYSATRTWCLHVRPSSRVGSVRLANSEGCVIPRIHVPSSDPSGGPKWARQGLPMGLP